MQLKPRKERKRSLNPFGTGLSLNRPNPKPDVHQHIPQPPLLRLRLLRSPNPKLDVHQHIPQPPLLRVRLLRHLRLLRLHLRHHLHHLLLRLRLLHRLRLLRHPLLRRHLRYASPTLMRFLLVRRHSPMLPPPRCLRSSFLSFVLFCFLFSSVLFFLFFL